MNLPIPQDASVAIADEAAPAFVASAHRAGRFGDRIAAVAAIAAAHADAVDREARFPSEAMAEIRRQRLLGALVPRDLGGEGASVTEMVDMCYGLGMACASTAMIFAMHQVKVACIVRHGRHGIWQATMLRRLAQAQLLLASSTTEGQAGGNIRSSAAPVAQDGAWIRLERDASVISYGAEADGLVTTARRGADAAASDQVLLTLLKDDYTLEPTQGWDTLGMRGTCSGGFRLRADCPAGRIMPVPYATIHAQTMVPSAHLWWGGAWAGIAAGAVERARSLLRVAARKGNGVMPPGASHLTRACATLATLRGQLAAAARRYQAVAGDERALAAFDFQAMINLTKVQASELALEIVMAAMRAAGLTGYRNDSAYAIGRHLRDVLSAPLMISNDRILAGMAATALVCAPLNGPCAEAAD